MAGIQKTFINFLWTRWCKMDVISIRLKEIEGLGYFSKILHENRSEFIRGLLEEGRKMKAVKLYKEKKLSLGLAAKLAGVTLSEFLDILEGQKIKLNITLDDAKEAMKNAEELL